MNDCGGGKAVPTNENSISIRFTGNAIHKTTAAHKNSRLGPSRDTGGRPHHQHVQSRPIKPDRPRLSKEAKEAALKSALW